MDPDTLLQNRYIIIRQIGQGGMGAVYEARDKRLGSVVAIKEATISTPELRIAFEREARLLAKLRHIALPKVIDHFSEGDGQFLVMDFIAGDDLGKMLIERGAPFPIDQVLRWADQLLDALDYLHNQEPPVIHRDIKPQNLKLLSDGQIVLLDFGLAKGAPPISLVGAGGSILGYTPHYAPLEQMEGAGADRRNDIYSLAASLYQLLTAIKPADALSRARCFMNGQDDPLRPICELNADVPQTVAAVLHASLAQTLEQRPPTASAMRKALTDAINAIPLIGAIKDDDNASTLRQGSDTPKNQKQDSETQFNLMNYFRPIAEDLDLLKTPLMHASEKGHTEVVKVLINAQANVNAKDALGRTALLYAAKNGHADIVSMLIDAGAEV